MRMIVAAILVVMLVGCCSTMDSAVLERVDANLERIGPVFSSYVEADPGLDTKQKERRIGLMQDTRDLVKTAIKTKGDTDE